MTTTRIRKITTAIAAAILCLFVAAISFLPATTYASESEQKTVRVGYVNVKGYEEGGEGEYKTGFGYEYLQTVSYYTNWKYEYVYGSFSELIAKLSAGEIDLMGNVTATEARAQTMNFSRYPEGNETFFVFVKNDKDDLASNPKALQGKRIGVGKNSYQSQLMDEYVSNLGISVQKVELNGTREVVAALEAGEIDAAIMTNATDYGYTPVQVVGFHDYYFAVAKNRTDLLEEIDAALAQIQSTDPNYNTTIAQKYSFGSAGANYLTKQEKAWLEDRNNTIRLGYLEDNLPYSATEQNGSLIGVISIVVQQLEEKYGIVVKTYPFKTATEAKEALAAGIVDCIGPAYGDYYLAEQTGVIRSDAMATTTPVILYKGELKTDVIAVGGNGLVSTQAVKTVFPNATIVEYPLIEEAMEAVARGEADCMVITSANLNVLSRYKTMQELSYSEMVQNVDICLLANHGEISLLTILNKAIYMSSTQAKGAAFVTSADGGESFSWNAFVRENGSILLVIALIIIALLAAALSYVLLTSRRAARAEARAQKSDELASAAQRGMRELSQQVVTDTLTGLQNRLSMQNDSEAIEDASKISVVSIDVNGLKAVNDNLGHEWGDKLLRRSGELISEAYGPFGKCYHVSGDEFVVIMDKNIEAVEELTRLLYDQCAHDQNDHFQVSLSIGYAKGTDNPQASFAELLHLADQRMYEEKVVHYRNKVFDRRTSYVSDSSSRVATELSEFVPGGYFAYDAADGEELIYVNSETLNIFECSTKEQFVNLVNGNFRGMVHPDDLERVEREIASQIRNHMDLDYTEYRIVTAKGNVKTVRDYGRYVSRTSGTGMFYVMISEM